MMQLNAGGVNMRDFLKFITCSLFGHEMFDEVFVKEVYSFKEKKTFYEVWERKYCARCGEVVSLTSLGKYTRTELLRRGWFFVEKNNEWVR